MTRNTTMKYLQHAACRDARRGHVADEIDRYYPHLRVPEWPQRRASPSLSFSPSLLLSFSPLFFSPPLSRAVLPHMRVASLDTQRRAHGKGFDSTRQDL